MRVHSAPAPSPMMATTFPSAGETATGPSGMVSLRIAEEVEAEEREQEQGRGERRMNQIPEQSPGAEKAMP